VNILPVILYFQDAALEARSPAFFANQFDIRQKLHLHRDRAVALARLATASRHIE
jgi:hypothetical protein